MAVTTLIWFFTATIEAAASYDAALCCSVLDGGMAAVQRKAAKLLFVAPLSSGGMSKPTPATSVAAPSSVASPLSVASHPAKRETNF